MSPSSANPLCDAGKTVEEALQQYNANTTQRAASLVARSKQNGAPFAPNSWVPTSPADILAQRKCQKGGG